MECGHKHEISIIYKCERCKGSLDVEYYYNEIFDEKELFALDTFREGIWKYSSLMPVNEDMNPVTLGEGNTPFFRSSKLIQKLGINNIYLKNESVNPTLSFKDRPLSVALTLAKQYEVEKVITASTGNTGVAAAAYAARAGIPCEIYIPASTPQEKQMMMEVYGAKIKTIEGTFSDAYKVAGETAIANDWLNLTSTFLNPFAIEGDKTLAYEIYEQYGGVPDWIIIPVGAGPLLVSCYKGFKELQLAGKIDSLPRMVGVQAEACAPIVEAFKKGTKVEPWTKSGKSVAGGIADPLTTYSQDGTRTLRTIIESNGQAIAVNDDSIIKHQRLLAEEEGVFVEPSSATALSALEKMKENELVQKDQSVVCVITGHGLKDLDVIKKEN